MSHRKEHIDTDLLRRWLGLILSVGFIVFFKIRTPFEGLTPAGMASIGIFLGSTILYVTWVVPMAVACLTIMILLPHLGVSTYSHIWQDFGGNAFLFVFFCFGITAALTPTNIPMRMAAWIMKVSKGNPKVIVYGFTFATALISGVVSNFAAVAMFAGVALAFLRSADIKPGKSNLGRCLMISLPAAAGIGGFFTPAASSINIIALQFMNQAGFSIRFLDWFLISAPFVFLTCFLLSFFLCLFFKPEPTSEELQRAVAQQHNKIGNISRKERLTIVIMVSTVILWFAGTWAPVLSPVFVVGCAVFVMFMPGVDLLTWPQFVKEVDWNVTFMVGAVGIVVGCVSTTGAMNWIVTTLLGGVAQLSPFWLTLLVGFVIAMLRMVIPTGPAVVAVFAPILLGLAAASGQSSVALVMLTAYWGGAAMVLVYTEPLLLYTFGSGYYSAMDMFKVGIFPTLLIVLVMALFFQPYVALFGY